MSTESASVNLRHALHKLGGAVTIRATGRRAEVRAVLFEAYTYPQYRVSFLTSAGDVAREWFHEDELESVTQEQAA